MLAWVKGEPVVTGTALSSGEVCATAPTLVVIPGFLGLGLVQLEFQCEVRMKRGYVADKGDLSWVGCRPICSPLGI